MAAGSRKSGSETKNRIADAAYRAASEAYAISFSVQEIAETASVTPAMVHYYFENKDGLRREVLRKRWIHTAERLALLNGTLAYSPPEVQLRTYVKTLIQDCFSHYVCGKHLGSSVPEEVFTKIFSQTTAHLDQIIKIGVKAEKFFLTPTGSDLALILFGSLRMAAENPSLYPFPKEPIPTIHELTLEKLITVLTVNSLLLVGYKDYT